jgi:preprotein translocase subunit SecD
MRRRQKYQLIGFIALTLVLVGGTILAGNKPTLGLDLQGGVSVVLKPTEDVPTDTLNQAIEIIRNRVDALGVAEPEITRQGSNVLVQLPGVKDKDRALALVGTTAELRFRPVLRQLPAEGTTLEQLGIDPNTTTTTAAPTTTVAPTTTTAAPGASTTTTASSTTTTVPPGSTTTTTPQTPEERRKQLEDLYGISAQTTKPEDDKPEATVILPEYDRKTGKMTARWEMGPAQLTGSGLDSAQAVYGASSGWTVSAKFKGGDDGTNQLNTLATACRTGTEICPAQRMGITLDSKVEFAGGISATGDPPFPDGEVSIQGGYSQSEAKDVALALRYGALPVQLVPQTTQTVSATLGNDAKNAGILAGIVGLSIVSIYVLLYYRLLGAVAIGSLTLSGGLLWAVIAYLGETRGLALTLAGITGIIVSIGVSLDSNIVYFEHMKEDIGNGRTPRSAAERSFPGAYSTVVKADVASLIGAGALYFLTVGAVKGFALYLGIATILDLLATYFFVGPLVQLVARRSMFSEHPGRFGLPSGRRAGAAAEGAS